MSISIGLERASDWHWMFN